MPASHNLFPKASTELTYPSSRRPSRSSPCALPVLRGAVPRLASPLVGYAAVPEPRLNCCGRPLFRHVTHRPSGITNLTPRQSWPIGWPRSSRAVRCRRGCYRCSTVSWQLVRSNCCSNSDLAGPTIHHPHHVTKIRTCQHSHCKLQRRNLAAFRFGYQPCPKRRRTSRGVHVARGRETFGR